MLALVLKNLHKQPQEESDTRTLLENIVFPLKTKEELNSVEEALKERDTFNAVVNIFFNILHVPFSAY